MGGFILALGVALGVGLLAERVGWLRPGAAWAAALVGGIPLGVGGFRRPWRCSTWWRWEAWPAG
ncbi:MAG: hypothetical protein RML14_07415 [Meiothermus sp.]|uniref:hypothetical protein n=1 Tax=Meiothermus sp. TaxID=1955249 RepID=UPI00298F282D|nr:hypothetical protein [Meiothermus sp.]MDW8481693.1 hypothetical protein [Meiothermus sp.]